MDSIQETYKDEHGVAMVAIVGLFVFLWLQYDYVTDVDATGVYVLTDSNGNVLASDLTPEDVIQIMQEMIDGEDTSTQGQD